MCFREKDMLRIHILSENSLLLTHSFGQKSFLSFIPLCNKDILFASLQYENSLNEADKLAI